MPEANDDSIRALFSAKRLRSGVNGLLILIGSSVLLGWMTDTQILKAVVPGLTTMKANTALGMLASSGGLLFIPNRLEAGAVWRLSIATILGLVAALLGALTVVEYASAISFGLDEFLFADPNTTSPPYPGRMSPATAAGFVAAGTAVLLLATGARARALGGHCRGCVLVAHMLGLVPAGIGYLSLAGYAYHLEVLYSFGPFVAVALNTAAGFGLLGPAILLSLPDEGWRRGFVERPIARRVLARLLPVSLISPFLAGLGVVWGARAHLFDPLYGPMLLAFAAASASAGLAWSAAAAVRRAEGDLLESERRLAGTETRLRHLAFHDPLTDLPNRSLLRDRLGHALDAATQANLGLAVLYLDLDRFKPINDLLGHAAGDRLLVQVSRRLRSQLRASDTVARMGGDEFVIVLSALHQPQTAADLAQSVLDSLTRPFLLGTREVEIGASIGIALFPSDGTNHDALLFNADAAMYRAKHDGPGSFRFYERSMNERLHERRLLEQDLRHAIERGEMELHYQPVVNVRSGEVDGFEALLRWRHPERGMISPASFIPLAEETGLITQIGTWVLKAACGEAAGWTRPYRVAVNVSPVQFRQAALVEAVDEALACTGLAPGRLEVEVTEGVLIEDTERAVRALRALRAEGVRVVLDDFGTGYSSLSYLHTFAFDKLKIDRSFVQSLGADQGAAVLVQAMIGLGHNLSLGVVAEGVETQTQLDALRNLGCDQVQGYLLGRPAPPQELIETGLLGSRSESDLQPGAGQARAAAIAA